MAAMHEEEIPQVRECANCGASENLLVCSRCHTEWFCSVKCQKAYWPFHKTQCRRHEFADLIEESEPKFARWMRAHGKLAVLKDDEVDRLERAAAAASGPSRQEVMESMYGRLEPKPKEPTYSAEERRAMRLRDEEESARTRHEALMPASFGTIDVPKDMGINCGYYKWRQNQSHVEVYVPLPGGMPASKISVLVQPTTLIVEMDERPVLKGALYREVKADESTWYIQDGVLELILLKRNRRGNYADGTTNADTFWRSLLKTAPDSEVLQIKYPPSNYYWSFCEGAERDTIKRLPPGGGLHAKIAGTEEASSITA